jgi:hypothetical protein
VLFPQNTQDVSFPEWDILKLGVFVTNQLIQFSWLADLQHGHPLNESPALYRVPTVNQQNQLACGKKTFFQPVGQLTVQNNHIVGQKHFKPL